MTDLSLRNNLPEDPESQENELLRISRVLWGRKYLIIVLVALFMVVTLVQLKRATPIFMAKATIEYEADTLRLFEAGEIGRPSNSFLELQTQLDIIKSPVITVAVIEALGTSRPRTNTPVENQPTVEDEFTVWTPVETGLAFFNNSRRKLRQWIIPTSPIDLPQQVINEENSIRRMQNRVSVRQRPSSRLIDIIVRHSNREMAAAIANEYAIQYRDYLVRRRAEAYNSAQSFYNDQLDSGKTRLEEAEQALFEYSREQNITLMTQESELAISQLNDISKEIFDLEKQVDLASNALAMDEQDEVLSHILAKSSSWNTLKNRLEELHVQKVQLAAENLPGHHEAQRLEREIQALDIRLEQEKAEIRKAQQGELKLLSSNLEVLKKRKSELTVYLSDLNTRMVRFNVLQRDFTAKSTLYDVLLRELNETSVASNIETSKINILQKAIVPRASTEPRVGQSLVTNSFLGFVLGCLIALGLSYIDRSIRDPKEIERMTRLPTLGTVPFMGGVFARKGTPGSGRKTSIRLIDSFDNYSREVEAFRLLRTSLQYSRPETPPSVILVTSVNPSEGKSTTCTNLALSFANLDRKTLLIDADLKLPSIHGIFATNREPGLTDILIGSKDSKDVIRDSGFENLDLMTAGHATVNPAELLESKAMNELLEKLKGEYDQIMIDTTPVSGLADPLALASKTDGVCMICSVGRTNIDDFKRIVERMRQLQVQILGVVYNHKTRGTKSTERYGKYGKKYGKYGDYGYYRKKEEDSSGNPPAEA